MMQAIYIGAKESPVPIGLKLRGPRTSPDAVDYKKTLVLAKN
jgi:hypothetical protein